MVNIVVHEPHPSVTVVVMVGVLPNSTRIFRSFPNPLPATVTGLPTVPAFGVIRIIFGRIVYFFRIVS